MKFEHFALNVSDVRAQAAWWVQHLGLSVVRKLENAPYTHFLADETGRVIVELYSNPAAAMPAYAQQHPLVFHVAFVSTDTVADRARLEKAGATFVNEDKPDGSSLLMMRDPWGVSLQFCQRAKPF
jgi:catechol 2,3-dioxygenase-like lactoylglutathione lyase family enzyme